MLFEAINLVCFKAGQGRPYALQGRCGKGKNHANAGLCLDTSAPCYNLQNNLCPVREPFYNSYLFLLKEIFLNLNQ